MKPLEKLILSIDTTNNLKTIIKLGKYKVERSYSHPREQELLTLIHKIMKEHNISFSQIKAIKVNLGPGSFTGIRVGIAVANALAWSLGILVNAKKQIQPEY